MDLDALKTRDGPWVAGESFSSFFVSFIFHPIAHYVEMKMDKRV
jgi:hypothetical protein